MLTKNTLAFLPDGGCALSGLPFVRPAFNFFTTLDETAGVGGLKIAEAFPEGRGSPHGCGLRAVFCTDNEMDAPDFTVSKYQTGSLQYVLKNEERPH
uniref:hypothetical protein n=1 Tax=Klebsiella aerogenes TaxID=548 RepID=UPI003F55A825